MMRKEEIESKSFRTWKLVGCRLGERQGKVREDMKRSGFEYVDELIFAHVEFLHMLNLRCPWDIS